MSYYVIKQTHESGRSRRVVIGAAVLLVALALLTGWAATRPIVVTIDGERTRIARSETVASLAQKGVVDSAPGKLLAVDGSVIATEGGYPPGIVRNGEPSRRHERLRSGDVINSVPGRDRAESVITTDVAVPYRTRYEGKGPLIEMETLGAPGVRRVQRGQLSAIEITSTVLREPADLIVRRFRTGGKVVALTFDDGPWPKYTARVLDVLADEKVDATFFMLGRQIKRYPQLARRAVREGHDVGSHSFSHPYFTKESTQDIRREIKQGRKAIEDETGQESPWLRPPYGAMNGRAWRVVRDTDARVVMWDVDSRDWERPGTRKIAGTVLRTVHPGSVVLFHDGGGNREQTARALRIVIKKLKKRGYEFVTVSELYEMRAEERKKKD